MQRNGGSSRVDMENLPPPSADGGRSSTTPNHNCATFMDTTNPHLSSAGAERNTTPLRRKSVLKRLLIGFCTGASIPASLGAYGMYQFNVYVATLPPGEFVCGNDALGPLMLIMFGAPLLGLIGAGIAAALP